MSFVLFRTIPVVSFLALSGIAYCCGISCTEPGIVASDPSASSSVVCVGQNVTISVSATDNDLVPGTAYPTCAKASDSVTYSWTGGGNPATGTGSSFSTSWDTPGVKTVTVIVDDGGSPVNDSPVTKYATVTVVEVDSISGDDVVCLNTDATFTATTNPSGHTDLISWSGGGTPATGSGDTFITQWDTPGVKTVKACCSGACATCYETKEVTVSSPPTVSISKPACDDEYVSGTVFIKAYASDSDGIDWVKFYVDDTLKGNMSSESNYWRYDWDTSGTSKGTHTIKVEAADNNGCKKSATRPVFAHPEVSLSQISFQSDHTLWDRASDAEITEPQWTTSTTKPFAYTIGSQMTVDVRMTSSDVTGTHTFAT